MEPIPENVWLATVYAKLAKLQLLTAPPATLDSHSMLQLVSLMFLLASA